MELRQRWQERVGEQEQSGLSIRAFCRQHELNEYSFYAWRRRLRGDGPIAFALVKASKAQVGTPDTTALELRLASGESLRIPCEEAALKLVLRVIRALA